MWDIEYTDEFGDWWDGLDDSEQDSVTSVVRLLEKDGPLLPFPFSSDVRGTKRYRMRELRIQHHGRPYRILYAFDPRRSALLILGGDKTGNARWYEQNVPRAEKIFQQYLVELDKESRRDEEVE